MNRDYREPDLLGIFKGVPSPSWESKRGWRACQHARSMYMYVSFFLVVELVVQKGLEALWT